MNVTIGDLLATPHLRLRLLAGTSGLERPVTWAHASDLDTPWDWLAGGELLMRNGRTLPKSRVRQNAFLESLSAAGAAGLVVGEDAQTPPLHPQVITRAEELAFPVLLTPFSVSFVAVARAVADANAGHDTARLGRIERIYRAARDVMAGRSQQPLTERLRHELDCKLLLLDAATARPLTTSLTPEADRIGVAVREALRQFPSGIPAVLHAPLPDDGDALVVDVPAEEPTVLAVYDIRGEPLDTTLLQHLATAVAVDVARQTMDFEHRRRLGAELLAHLLQGRVDVASASADLEAAELPPPGCVMAAVRAEQPADWSRLHVALARRGIPALLLAAADTRFVLLPDSAGALRALRDRLGDDTLIGISSPLATPDRGPSAQREALWALSLARQRKDHTARYGEAAELSILRTPDEALALVDRVLGPIIDYDTAHGTELLHTLTVYLRARRSWQRAAQALSVHKQTVIYRIQRVEQLTDLDLTETGHLTELWLAVQARDLLAGSNTGQQADGA